MRGDLPEIPPLQLPGFVDFSQQIRDGYVHGVGVVGFVAVGGDDDFAGDLLFVGEKVVQFRR
jgi:hypothetical protein